MAQVDFQLKPREPKTEQCWIFVNGELVEKCAAADRVARLAAHGKVEKTYTARQAARIEAAGRGNRGGYGLGNRYNGR